MLKRNSLSEEAMFLDERSTITSGVQKYMEEPRRAEISLACRDQLNQPWAIEGAWRTRKRNSGALLGSSTLSCEVCFQKTSPHSIIVIPVRDQISCFLTQTLQAGTSASLPTLRRNPVLSTCLTEGSRSNHIISAGSYSGWCRCSRFS